MAETVHHHISNNSFCFSLLKLLESWWLKFGIPVALTTWHTADNSLPIHSTELHVLWTQGPNIKRSSYFPRKAVGPCVQWKLVQRCEVVSQLLLLWAAKAWSCLLIQYLACPINQPRNQWVDRIASLVVCWDRQKHLIYNTVVQY